jgi:hypothetical protein
MQAAITEPPTLVGQLAQLLTELGIIVLRGTVTHALAIGIYDSARPPFAHPVTGLEMSHSFPLRGGRQNPFARRSSVLPSGPDANREWRKIRGHVSAPRRALTRH